MAENNCFDMTKLIFQIMCVTVVRWSSSCLNVQINRVRLPACPGVAVFCFYAPFFFLFGLFFLTLFFLLAFFSLVWPCWSCTWINIYIFSADILGLSPEFYFGKGISKALDLHTGQAYDQKKTISCQDMSLLWNSWIFFNVSWHHDKQHTVHHKLY